MLMFSHKKWNLSEIKEKPFKLEKNLQEMVEKNMDEVLGLQCVCSEFTVGEFRIDSLAYDYENKSFVIVEYKRGSSFSVVDQWYSYLALLLNNQAEFVLKYNEVTGQALQKKDIDRESSKVMFVANGFTPHQRNAINFKDLPIELWEAKKFSNGIIIFDQIRAKKTNASVKTISKDETVAKVNKEVKKYTVDDHFKDWRDTSKEMFDELSEKLQDIHSSIEEVPVKFYIWYKIWNSNVVEVKTYKSKLDIILNRVQPQDLNSPQKSVSYIEHSMKHYNKHQSKFEIKDSEDIDYAIFLTKQVIKKFFM